MRKLYHVLNKGDKVLFRDKADYICFNNKMAVYCHRFNIGILAATIMSTHFHSVVEAYEENSVAEWMNLIRKSYGITYMGRYGHSLSGSMDVNSIEINGRDAIINEMIYVMKNPVHHYVSISPFAYEFSSARYVFEDCMKSRSEIDVILKQCRKYGSLSGRQQQQLTGRQEIPGEWMVRSDGLILPSSYMKFNKARVYWDDSFASYMYHMNRRQTDVNHKVISDDSLYLRSNGLSDIDVCRVIDNYALRRGRKSFHFLAPEEKALIRRVLSQQAVPEEQVRRCLWD